MELHVVSAELDLSKALDKRLGVSKDSDSLASIVIVQVINSKIPPLLTYWSVTYYHYTQMTIVIMTPRHFRENSYDYYR